MLGAEKIVSGLAAPPPRTVIRNSEWLSQQLVEAGLMSRRLAYETTALERNLALAGRRTHHRNAATREELQAHLDYWAAVNRVRADLRRGERVLIEDFAREILADCPRGRFFARAAAGDGLSGYDVRGIAAAGKRYEKLTARNCRMIGGVVSKSEIGTLDLAESSLLGIRFDDVRIERLLAPQQAVFGMECDIEVGEEANFSDSTFRQSTLTIKAPTARVDFSWSDLATNATQHQWELRALAEEEGQEIDDGADAGATTFVDCEFGDVIFERVFLQGVSFVGCTFKEARFDGADLTGCRFEGCDLGHAQFGRHPGRRGDSKPRRAVLKRTRFVNCSLDGADRSGAVGRPIGWR